MYVTILSAGNDAQGGVGTYIQNPSLDDVEMAVRALDGVHNTMVVLGTDGPGHMAIGGGAGRYIVYSTPDNLTFYVPIDPVAPQGSITLVAGGEEGEYPARQTADLDSALRAARTYTRDGSQDPTLTWEQA
jgi:Immunity protein Imm1